MVHPTIALSAADIHEGLQSLPDWRFCQNAIERVYVGTQYLAVLEKLNAIAQLSEKADHHPDLILQWKKLTIRYWTHTVQGVTVLDFELAHQVEALLK